MISKPTTHAAKIHALAMVFILATWSPIGCSDDAGTAPDPDMTIAEVDMRVSAPDAGETQDASDASIAGLLDLQVGEPGPYNTGYRSVMHSYEVTPGETREILVNVWYPTEATEGDLTRYLGGIRDTESFLNAEVAESPWPDGNFPVHVYSHGDQGFGGTAAQLMRHFASHGWVSVAPDHTGNTLDNNLDPRPPALRAWRSLDVSASLDAAAALDDELQGLNTEGVFMSGHSFGGFTVWATAGSTFDDAAINSECELDAMPLCTAEEIQLFQDGVEDSRVLAAFTIAGNYSETWFGADGFASVGIPIIALSGTADPRGHEEEFELISGVDLTWIDVEGACHESFTLGGGCNTIEDSEAFEIVDSYALAAARHYVLGDDSEAVLDLLNGEVFPNDKVVTFRQK